MKLRRVHVKRVEPDPVGVVHESEVIEIDCKPMLLVLMRAGPDCKFTEERVTNTMKAVEQANPDRSVVVACLDSESDIELWEEEE